MRLRRGKDWTTPSWEDHARAWGFVLFCLGMAALYVLLGWAIPLVAGWRRR
jgi:hypothetical protein